MEGMPKLLKSLLFRWFYFGHDIVLNANSLGFYNSSLLGMTADKHKDKFSASFRSSSRVAFNL